MQRSYGTRPPPDATMRGSRVEIVQNTDRALRLNKDGYAHQVANAHPVGRAGVRERSTSEAGETPEAIVARDADEPDSTPDVPSACARVVLIG
ncbi:hypothetical protein [Streptomyces sp. NPDC031705]|uniref:hypothetical protein n=1 Tax=Streptomyces sp. NPDC031705 TaxID=3155729 RepID=UPI003409949F